MYNERAMLSMKKVGIDFRDIRMAVLCQRVVQARRACSFSNPNAMPRLRCHSATLLVTIISRSLLQCSQVVAARTR